MNRIPAVTSRDMVKILKHAGFREHRQKGSHLTLIREADGTTFTIPVHAGKTLGRGLAIKILSQAGISGEDFDRFHR